MEERIRPTTLEQRVEILEKKANFFATTVESIVRILRADGAAIEKINAFGAVNSSAIEIAYTELEYIVNELEKHDEIMKSNYESIDLAFEHIRKLLNDLSLLERQTKRVYHHKKKPVSKTEIKTEKKKVHK